ncbi:MAG: hypothetical protein LBI30_00170 [Holosporales bacterium]|jgi:hypothetical protein|nr:hypothetical protein [Holosporales bacterium]
MTRLILIATVCLGFTAAYGALPGPDPTHGAMDAEAASPATAPVVNKRLPRISIGQLQEKLPDAVSMLSLLRDGNFPKIQEESDRLGILVPDLCRCSRLQFLQTVILPHAAAMQLFYTGQTGSPLLLNSVSLERPFYSSDCDDFVHNLHSILEETKSLATQSFKFRSISDSIKCGIRAIGDWLHLTDPEGFKKTMWPSLVARVGEMLHFGSEEGEFFLSTGLNAIVCRQGSAQHTGYVAECGLDILAGGFYDHKNNKIVIFTSSQDRILPDVFHEAGHAFAAQRLGGDIGEFYSVFFEIVGAIVAMDLGMLSKSDAIWWFINTCESILFDLAPICESLEIAKGYVSNPGSLTNLGPQFGLVEHTDSLVDKYFLWISGVDKNSVGELLEGKLRAVTNETFGVRNRSTGEYYTWCGVAYDPVYYENHGTGAIAALMVLRRVIEGPGQLSFEEILVAIKDHGETCLRHFTDVTTDNVIPALGWLYARTIGRFEQ